MQEQTRLHVPQLPVYQGLNSLGRRPPGPLKSPFLTKSQDTAMTQPPIQPGTEGSSDSPDLTLLQQVRNSQAGVGPVLFYPLLHVATTWPGWYHPA